MVDESAFNDYFRKYYGELFVFACSFVDSKADCEDIVSDAFEDAWRHLSKLEADSLRPYLYKNVRNKCIDHLRHLSTRRNYAELMKRITVGYDSADRLLEMMERERIVKQALDRLPDYTRQIFTACYVEHKQYREVAEQMGISPNTVKKYVMQALRQIREQRQE